MFSVSVTAQVQEIVYVVIGFDDELLVYPTCAIPFKSFRVVHLNTDYNMFENFCVCVGVGAFFEFLLSYIKPEMVNWRTDAVTVFEA